MSKIINEAFDNISPEARERVRERIIKIDLKYFLREIGLLDNLHRVQASLSADVLNHLGYDTAAEYAVNSMMQQLSKKILEIHKDDISVTEPQPQNPLENTKFELGLLVITPEKFIEIIENGAIKNYKVQVEESYLEVLCKDLLEENIKLKEQIEKLNTEETTNSDLGDVMQWVAVSELLPNCDWVFCWMPSQGTFTKGYLLNGKWELQGFDNSIKVSHWMPLLKPPCA